MAKINSDWLYTEVGRRIRELREERQLSQQQLATLVGRTRTSITNIEMGHQRLPLALLYSIAKALKVEPTALLPPASLQDDPQELISGVPEDKREWAIKVLGNEP